MFLEPLRKRNPAFLNAVIALHQATELPANAYVLDLDAVRANAAALRAEADRHGLEVFAMTKQVGRAPGLVRALLDAGIDAGVAVDMTDARALARVGMAVGHVGHLVQIPGAETASAAALEPWNWTVFSDDKAREAATASRAAGREQPLLARIQAPGDMFYEGHEGGFEAADVLVFAERLNALDGARFAGITTFPALLFDAATGRVGPTPNLATLERAVTRLRDAGIAEVRVNAPGTTSSTVLGLLAERGVTQVEPGHGLTGTTPLHAVRDDLVEVPAVCYLTEVSHRHAGRAFAFGGGLYIDRVFPDYALRALVAEAPALGDARLLDATIPPPAAIDYYSQLDYGSRAPRTGATVIFGFRIQAFVTRALVAGLEGVATGSPRVVGIWTADGENARWP